MPFQPAHTSVHDKMIVMEVSAPTSLLCNHLCWICVCANQRLMRYLVCTLCWLSPNCLPNWSRCSSTLPKKSATDLARYFWAQNEKFYPVSCYVYHRSTGYFLLKYRPFILKYYIPYIIKVQATFYLSTDHLLLKYRPFIFKYRPYIFKYRPFIKLLLKYRSFIIDKQAIFHWSTGHLF